MMSENPLLALPLVAMLSVTLIVSIAGCAVMVLFGRRVLARLSALEGLLDDSLDASDELTEKVDAEIGRLRSGVQEQLRRSEQLSRQVEQLAVDIVRRDACLIEAPAAQRGNVIDAARGGHGVEALVHDHGLSADEAELLVLLHGDGMIDVESPVR